MTGSLDRLLEQRLATLIDAESTAIQCVANLLGAGESNATVPRVAVHCESLDTEEFQETPEGIYGIYEVRCRICSIAEATSSTSSAQMEEMNSAIDSVADDADIAANLTSGSLKVWGVVPGEWSQEQEDNRIIRERILNIWARVQ